ncbi:G-protein coupled receptor family C group 6 member A isoform 1-T1 [Menidia menidia]
MKKMKQFLTFFLFFSVLLRHFFFVQCMREAKASGDIIIGGLFPIHEGVGRKSVNDPWTCNRLSVGRLAQSLVLVHAVEEINKNRVLGNITLGYHIVDSCGDVTTALKNTQSFMKANTDRTTPPVLAVVGDYYSEISIAVTRQLNLENIPQISYGATSGLLSDKTRFPSFMRTVPEDDHQAKAIVKILKDHNWTWVGVVTTDGEYGRYALERLRYHATKDNICFAYTAILPEFFADERLEESINSTIKSIVENRNVKVIISFAKVNHMMYVFNGVLEDPRGREKVWLASDNWSQSTNALNTKTWNLSNVGTVFGITLKSGNTFKFVQFLHSLRNETHKNNPFLEEFLKDDKEKGIGELINMTYPYSVFSIELAVTAIAQAVKDLCIRQKCNISTLQPKEFRKALRNATFTMDGKTYEFDDNGDVNSGYDVILWKETSPSVIDMNNFVGHYDIEKSELKFSRKQDLYNLTQVIISKCSNSCQPGQIKKSADGQPSCCYQCESCPDNYFSNITDSTECYQCDSNFSYSKAGDSRCTAKKVLYFKYDHKYHIVLLVFTGLGALLTLVVGIIFVANWRTPVVRSSVGPVSILLLTSLFFTFGSVVLFGGEPNPLQCQARHVLFGLSFTLSVSCILVRSFKIVLAMEFNPDTKHILKKLYKPYLIIPACMAGQVIICTLWLIYKPPKEEWEINEKNRVLYCHEKSKLAFGVLLGYIGFLALICLVVAFKGRKLPECYNEAKFITFSMLIYFIAWIIFGPVYVELLEKNMFLPAVEMVVILISAYGILFCQFFTKCYIILFKREANTEKAFRKEIRNYSEKDRGGIKNLAFSMDSLSKKELSDSLTDQKSSVHPTMSMLSSHSLSNPKSNLLSD